MEDSLPSAGMARPYLGQAAAKQGLVTKDSTEYDVFHVTGRSLILHHDAYLVRYIQCNATFMHTEFHK